jgi:hypothetical protein
MTGQIFRFLTLLFVVQLVFPSTGLGKRPKGDDVLFLSEKIKLVKEKEEAGEYREAEEMYLELYEESKKEFRWHQGSENHWRDYMTSLRALIRFYYDRGRFQDVDWYFREYNDELEEDEEVGSMHWMLMSDIEESVQKLIKGKKYKEAELIYLDLENRITSTLGFRHYLLGLLYKNMAAFYVKTGDQDKAAEYAKKAGVMMKDE